jgi:hypothetical protein
MSVKLQRLNTSKVANVGGKAKVWPDEQYRGVCVAVWSGRWWVLEKAEAERREGKVYSTIFRPRSRSGPCMHERGSSLATDARVKVQVMQMVIHPIRSQRYGATQRV